MNREFVKAYSEKTDYVGKLEQPDGEAIVHEPNSTDYLMVQIKTHREVITEIRYENSPSACPPVKASSAYIVECAHNQPVMAAYLLTADKICEKFAFGPETKHCAIMAELALKRAISDYVQKRNAKLASKS